MIRAVKCQQCVTGDDDNVYTRDVPGFWPPDLPDTIKHYTFLVTTVRETLTMRSSEIIRIRRPKVGWNKSTAAAFDADFYMWSDFIDAGGETKQSARMRWRNVPDEYAAFREKIKAQLEDNEQVVFRIPRARVPQLNKGWKKFLFFAAPNSRIYVGEAHQQQQVKGITNDEVDALKEERLFSKVSITPQDNEQLFSSPRANPITEYRIKSGKVTFFSYRNSDKVFVRFPASAFEEADNLFKGFSAAASYDAVARDDNDVRSQFVNNLAKFNNHVKRELILEHVRPGAWVLDMAIGKGGDLDKYDKARIAYLRGIDISPLSVREAERRACGANDPTERSGLPMAFKYRFSVGDMTKPFDEQPFSQEIECQKFDVISVQMAFHYAWKSREALENTLANMFKHLKDGGKIIMTIPVSARMLQYAQRTTQYPDLKIKYKGGGWDKGAGIAYTFKLGQRVRDETEWTINLNMLEDMCRRQGYYVHDRGFETYGNPPPNIPMLYKTIVINPVSPQQRPQQRRPRQRRRSRSPPGRQRRPPHRQRPAKRPRGPLRRYRPVPF